MPINYQAEFYVGEQFQILINSDMPFPTYAPGDILLTYDDWKYRGRGVMGAPAYRIVRTEHTILTTREEQPKAVTFILYVYTARLSRMAVLFEGVKTVARALLSASVVPQHPRSGTG